MTLLPLSYLQRYAHRLSQWDLTATDRLSAFLPSYQTIYANEPPVLIHVDYRLDNMMFGGPYPLTVVDWQSLSTGCPLADVSYFLGTSLLEPLEKCGGWFAHGGVEGARVCAAAEVLPAPLKP